MCSNFGQFILIFNIIALIFLGALIAFTALGSIFTKSNCIDFIANDEWPQFIRPQSTRLSGLGIMLESYRKLQQKPKTVLEF